MIGEVDLGLGVLSNQCRKCVHSASLVAALFVDKYFGARNLLLLSTVLWGYAVINYHLRPLYQ